MQGEQTGTAVPAPFGLYASTPKKCLVKDKYQAKSWYNHYQENVYTLPERIRGVQSISIVVYPSIKLSLQGFYCKTLSKAYGKVYAIENNTIYGTKYKTLPSFIEVSNILLAML